MQAPTTDNVTHLISLYRISVPFSVKDRIIDEHNLYRRVWQLASDGMSWQNGPQL